MGDNKGFLTIPELYKMIKNRDEVIAEMRSQMKQRNQIAQIGHFVLSNGYVLFNFVLQDWEEVDYDSNARICTYMVTLGDDQGIMEVTSEEV